MYAQDKPHPPLERALIIATAIDLMHEVGLDALTTRRLAERLGVKSPALYWHIGSMDELREGMCEAVLQAGTDRVRSGRDGRKDWRRWLIDNAVEARATLGSLRDGGRLIAQARWTEETTAQLIERLLGPVVESGVSRARGVQIIAAVNSYCLGWVVMEERADHRAFMADRFDADRLFVEGAWALVNGMAPDE